MYLLSVQMYQSVSLDAMFLYVDTCSSFLYRCSTNRCYSDPFCTDVAPINVIQTPSLCCVPMYLCYYCLSLCKAVYNSHWYMHKKHFVYICSVQLDINGNASLDCGNERSSPLIITLYFSFWTFLNLTSSHEHFIPKKTYRIINNHIEFSDNIMGKIFGT